MLNCSFFDETLVQLDFAVVHCSDVMMSVFHFPVLTVVHCSDVVMSVFHSPVDFGFLRCPNLERWLFIFSSVTHKISGVDVEKYAYYVNKLHQNVGLETWKWRQIVTSQTAHTKYKWSPYDPQPKPPPWKFSVYATVSENVLYFKVVTKSYLLKVCLWSSKKLIMWSLTIKRCGYYSSVFITLRQLRHVFGKNCKFLHNPPCYAQSFRKHFVQWIQRNDRSRQGVKHAARGPHVASDAFLGIFKYSTLSYLCCRTSQQDNNNKSLLNCCKILKTTPMFHPTNSRYSSGRMMKSELFGEVIGYWALRWQTHSETTAISILCSKEAASLFFRCSNAVKNVLFRSFCTPIYVSQIWCNFRKSSMQRLRVAYNFGCRALYNLPWRASFSSHQVQCNIPTFEALLRKYKYLFLKRCRKSNNVCLRALMQSDCLYSSLFFEHYNRILLCDWVIEPCSVRLIDGVPSHNACAFYLD